MGMYLFPGPGNLIQEVMISGSDIINTQSRAI